MRRQWPQRRAMYFILCWRYLNANIAQIQKNTFFAKKIVKPPSTPSSKLAQTQIMCDLQSRLSKLLKKPYQKLVENCQRQPQFWQSCYKIHVRMEYYWYAKLNLRNMALRYSSVHTKKRFSKKTATRKLHVSADECIWRCDHFDVGLMKIDSLFTKICTKDDFFAFSLYSDLDLWPFDLKFAPQLLVSMMKSQPSLKFLWLSDFE